jgi:hypothetical protein
LGGIAHQMKRDQRDQIEQQNPDFVDGQGRREPPKARATVTASAAKYTF